MRPAAPPGGQAAAPWPFEVRLAGAEDRDGQRDLSRPARHRPASPSWPRPRRRVCRRRRHARPPRDGAKALGRARLRIARACAAQEPDPVAADHGLVQPRIVVVLAAIWATPSASARFPARRRPAPRRPRPRSPGGGSPHRRPSPPTPQAPAPSRRSTESRSAPACHSSRSTAPAQRPRTALLRRRRPSGVWPRHRVGGRSTGSSTMRIRFRKAPAQAPQPVQRLRATMRVIADHSLMQRPPCQEGRRSRCGAQQIARRAASPPASPAAPAPRWRPAAGPWRQKAPRGAAPAPEPGDWPAPDRRCARSRPQVARRACAGPGTRRRGPRRWPAAGSGLNSAP
jgi:hypothetical protein